MTLRRHILSGLALLAALAALLIWSPPAPAQTVVGPSGLALPRFVSLRSAPANVRVGPGTRYDIAWIFLRPGVPVEIVQEFDTWRKIRDVDGAEGWLHQSLLVGNRTALVTPWNTEGPIALRAGEGEDSTVRAWLSPGLLVDMRRCNGTVCEVSLTHRPEGGRATTYRGFAAQAALWGVYAGETFD